MRYEAAVFDMDGTILNTLGDLTDSLNWALAQTGHRQFSEREVRLFFGSAVKTAVNRALSVENGAPLEGIEEVGESVDPAVYGVDQEEVQRIVRIYTPHYAANCAVRTRPYDGIPELIRRLRNGGVKTAVVSNKPDEAVRILVKDQFDGLFDTFCGEKTGIRRKPAPDLTLSSLKKLGVPASKAVYIGDTEIDIETAENSCMDCILVGWGFRSEEFLRKKGAGTICPDAEAVYRHIMQ